MGPDRAERSDRIPCSWNGKEIGMKTIHFLLTAALACSAGLTRAAEPASALEIKTLIQAALAKEFTPGREVIVDSVWIPPNTTLDWHRHPGEEFQYYLEGEIEVRIEGAPSIIGKPGMVGHVPYMKRHQAVSGPNGARALVFRVHSQGEPVRMDEAEPSATPH
jgi:quercetin dioxygenase-like cupin family protein